MAEDVCSKHVRRRFKLSRRIFLFSGMFYSIFAMKTAAAMWSTSCLKSTCLVNCKTPSDFDFFMSSKLFNEDFSTTWICRSISCLYSVHLAQVSSLSCLISAVGLPYKEKQFCLAHFEFEEANQHWQANLVLAYLILIPFIFILKFIDLDLNN